MNSCVCVTKPNGKLRLCLDPKDLNNAIQIPHHYTPTLDYVLPKLNGAQFFTILDARSGYRNIKLDEESSYHTTFNTPYERHRFTRLPFGLNCAQDVFQKKIDETFSDIHGVAGILADIIVVGYKSDGSDHDANLTAVITSVLVQRIRLHELVQPVYVSMIRRWSFAANAFRSSETSLVQMALNQTMRRLPQYST